MTLQYAPITASPDWDTTRAQRRARKLASRKPYIPGGTSQAMQEERARRESDKRPHVKRGGFFVPAAQRDNS